MAFSRKVSAFARLVTDADYARSRRSGSLRLFEIMSSPGTGASFRPASHRLGQRL